MGTGASTTSQEWSATDADNSAVDDARPRTAANANLPANDMTGLTKLVEAKNRFMKIKSKEKNTACFQKQVLNNVCLCEIHESVVKVLSDFSLAHLEFENGFLQEFYLIYGAIGKTAV